MSGVTRQGAAVIGAMVLLAAACAGDDPISAPSTTEAPAESTTTESSTTTVEATTTTEATPATEPDPTTTVTEPTEPRELPYWTEECTELAGDTDASYAAEPRLETFTTLGAAPVLDLVMPQVVTSAGPYGSIGGTVPIPGGVLVGVYPPDGWPAADEILYSSSLVAVDHSGAIRWRRCFDDDIETRGFMVAPAASEPEVAWVLSTPWNGPSRIIGVDLATGADVEFPVDVTELGDRGGGSQRFVVLGPKYGGGAVEAGDRLLIVDSLDGSTTEVPVPPSWVGSEGGWVQVIEDGSPDTGYVLADGSPSPGETAAVYMDGSWTVDSAVRREHLPPQIAETFDEPFELRLYDGAGELVWSVPEFHGISREGFRWAVADDVVVAMRCAEWDENGFCTWVDDEPPQEELVGFDLETGEQLWVRDGQHAVPVVAGNVAVVTDWSDETIATSGYVLIDLVTGERTGPDGDPWPEGAFAQECCGGDAYVNVRQHGGVVVATNMEHVRVWYPPEFTTPTATVDLMS